MWSPSVDLCPSSRKAQRNLSDGLQLGAVEWYQSVLLMEISPTEKLDEDQMRGHGLSKQCVGWCMFEAILELSDMFVGPQHHC